MVENYYGTLIRRKVAAAGSLHFWHHGAVIKNGMDEEQTNTHQALFTQPRLFSTMTTTPAIAAGRTAQYLPPYIHPKYKRKKIKSMLLSFKP